jgi:hypothetical protein
MKERWRGNMVDKRDTELRLEWKEGKEENDMVIDDIKSRNVEIRRLLLRIEHDISTSFK